MNNEIPYVESLPAHWSVIQNRFLFQYYGEKVGEASAQYQLLSLTTAGVKERDINAMGGKVPASYDNYQTVRKGQMVFCLFDLDCSAVFSGISNYDGMITSAYDVFSSTGRMDNAYADYWFKYVFSNRYYKMFSKSIRYTITGDMFRSLKTPVPPVDEQRRIASFLLEQETKVDALIANVQAQIEKLKAYKQSVITEVVTKGLDPNVPMKDSGVEWIGEIAEHWKVVSLGGVTTEMRNGYVGPTRDLFFDDGIRYIQSLHTKDGFIDFDKHPYYVSEEWANQHPKVHTGDVLIVQTGDIGQVALVRDEFDGCNCHALIIATPNQTLINPEYLTYYLLSYTGKELMLSFKTGALLPHLNSGKIKSTPVCVPDLGTQSRIAEYLREKIGTADQLIAIKQKKIDKLNEYKKSLIYEYVTGKKEVS